VPEIEDIKPTSILWKNRLLDRTSDPFLPVVSFSDALTFQNVEDNIMPQNLTGPMASLPTPGQAGRLYLPTDGQVIFEDNGVSWQAYGPISILASPQLSDFTWANQGDASAVQTNAGITINVPEQGSVDNFRLLMQSVPTAPYTITTYIQAAILSSEAQGVGLCWRNSGSEGLILYINQGQGSTGVRKYNNPSSYNSDYVFTGGITNQNWFRISDDGTNRNAFISPDGINWTNIFSVSNTDFITPD
jgi:hypothetical protein